MKKIIIATLLAFVAGISTALAGTITENTAKISFNGPAVSSSPLLILNFIGTDASTLFVSKQVVMNSSIEVPSSLKIVSGGIYVATSNGQSIPLPQQCLVSLNQIQHLDISFNPYPAPTLKCQTA